MGHETESESWDTATNAKSDIEEILSSYKRLKGQNENQGRTIVGLNTEKEDVKQRLRNLINKRIESQGPDFDEYCMNRRNSRQYEHIDPSRVPTRVLKRGLSSDRKFPLHHQATIETEIPESQ